jgi:putative ABC transport system permease protein
MLNYLFKIFLRNFQKQKAYTLINVFGLSLGLAVVIVILFWIQFHLSFNQSIENNKNIYRIVQRIVDGDESELISPTPGALAGILSNRFPEIIHASRVHYGPDLVIQTDKDTFVEKRVLFVDSTFLQIFDYPYIHGQKPLNLNNGIILSESVALKYFGSDNPVGKILSIAGGHNFTVKGVIENLPANMHFNFNILLPISLAISRGAEVFPEKWYRFAEVETYIETQPKADINSLNSKIRYLKAEYSEYKNDELILQPIRNIHLEPDIRYNYATTISHSTLLTFAIIAFLLLSIACLNYIILTVGLSAERIKSTGIRLIFGSSKFLIIVGILLESIFLTFLAWIFSIVLIELLSSGINQLLDIDLSLLKKYSGPIFSTSILVTMFIGILNGLYPAILLSNTDPLAIFKKYTSPKVSKLKILKSLVIIQFSIGIILLIYSGTINNQLKFMISKDPGFDRENLISIGLYDESRDKLFNISQPLIDEIKSIHGIENASLSCSSPSVISTSAGLAEWDGQKAGEEVYVQWNSIFFNYFETIGVPIIKGRDFTEFNENDITRENQARYILNETAIKSMGLTPDEAINRNFTLYGKSGPIIGIVKDFNFKSLHETIKPMAFDILPFYFRTFLIRSENRFSQDLLKEVKEVWKKHLPEDPFDYVYEFDSYQKVYQSENRLLSYNKIIAFLIIVISSLGFSGLAFLVLDQKTNEIGIRKVHGASVKNLIQHLLNLFFKWILAAIIIAVPTGYLLSSFWLRNYAYKTTIGFKTFLIPIIIIVLISFSGIIYRVIQCSVKNPVDSIKYE